MFPEIGSLLIGTEDYSRPYRPYDERYTWIDPEHTTRFLNAIGEEGRRPEFRAGEPTPQTKSMLRRVLKQFSSTDDLGRCWRKIVVCEKSFAERNTD